LEGKFVLSAAEISGSSHKRHW